MGKKGFQADWHRERGVKRAPYAGPSGNRGNDLTSRSVPDPEIKARKERIEAIKQQSSDKAMVIELCSGPINLRLATFVSGLSEEFIQSTLKEAGLHTLDDDMRQIM